MKSKMVPNPVFFGPVSAREAVDVVERAMDGQHLMKTLEAFARGEIPTAAGLAYEVQLCLEQAQLTLSEEARAS